MAEARRASAEPAPTPARLFTVRIWSEVAGGAVEHRGEVREMATGAHRGFARFDDLTAFLTEQLETPLPPSRAAGDDRRH